MSENIKQVKQLPVPINKAQNNSLTPAELSDYRGN